MSCEGEEGEEEGKEEGKVIPDANEESIGDKGRAEEGAIDEVRIEPF